MTTNQNDIVELAARAEFGGTEDVVNVFQFQLISVAPVSDIDTANGLGLYLEDFYDHLTAHQATDYIYRDYSVRNITQDTVLGVFSWPTLTAGSGSAVNIAPGVAGVINLATSVARVVLRKFIGGIVSGSMENDGTIGSTLVSALIAAAAELLSDRVDAGATWRYGHFSPKTSSFVPPVAATVTDIPGYQRRRKQGRGV